ncbi:hypothetical protein EK21DRAFT_112836 [Setomelanomma holmii]|uniref:Luciferase-like domain-containing protein n=1 Tax=Setomelanomma holmii TaxID=210430 RepID=A0A9P4LM99_9PLEO|nr:hypothetical protein EK21DRAFT_112836 [Setomelanomma holmii]
MPSAKIPKKRTYLNFFEHGCVGSYMSPGQWRDPNDTGESKDRLSYWLNLARAAERGKISFMFFADSYSTFNIFGGSPDAVLRWGSQFAVIDPMVIIPAMASVTKSLGSFLNFRDAD